MLRHILALGDEYAFRYNKKHKSVNDLYILLSQLPWNMPLNAMTPIAQAMPDEYKDEDPVKAYRNYCIAEKTYAKWEKGREKPEWWV